MHTEYRGSRLFFYALVFLATAPVGTLGVCGEELPMWEPSATGQVDKFQLGNDGRATYVWGRGRELPRFYFPEFLPALFERTLVLDRVDWKDARLEWIFTGPRGGVTISIGPSTVELRQRYYDSFGYNAVKGGKPQRFPQWDEKSETVAYEGQLRAVTIRMDHTLQLSIALNGREVIRRLAPLDVTQHQMRLTGVDGKIGGRMIRPAAEKVNVAVDPARRRQKMIGFGGITTPTAYAQLSPEGKKQWWRLLCEYNLLIQREYPIGTRLLADMSNWDLVQDAMPHYYGDNFPNSEITDFEYLKRIRGLGGQIWFEFWALPPWACSESHGSKKQGIPKSRRVDSQAYVRAMLDYCRTCRQRTGAPPEIVGIQNEVAQSAKVWHEMTLALRRGLDEAGFKQVRIHMSDSGSLRNGIKRAEAFTANEQVWKAIDYSATHMYDFQHCFTKPDDYDPLLKRWRQITQGKPFLSTELCVNSGGFQWPGYRLALSMGQLYHKNLTLADASALCYCWTLLNVVQPSFAWTRTLFVPNPQNGFVPIASSNQLRVFGAYSRRIKRGMSRVEAVSANPNLLVSAFKGKGNISTIVLLNRSLRPLQVTLHCQDAKFTQQEVVSPYSSGIVCAAPTTNASGATQLTIEPGSIVTLTNVPLGKLPTGWKLD